jgi:hypothetical protein
MQPISEFINDDHAVDEELILDSKLQKKYADGLNVISARDPQARAICFASSYSRSLNASGSLIEMDNGSWRHFSPDEILALFGFPKSFSFPKGMPLTHRFRLAGNSVDLRSIRTALRLVGLV